MKRINEIVDLITPYKIVADVGCDHAYLIKRAFDLNLISKAYAIDNKKGPLNNAKMTLAGYQNVSFLLSDGLTDLASDTEVVVLAGMGGSLIVNILEKGLNKLDNVKRIIIEANRNQDLVRKFASDNGFKIVYEKIIEEDSIFYEIIVLEKGFCKLSSLEIKFGPLLLKQRDELFIKKWQKQLLVYENKKSKYLDREIEKIKDVLK